MHPRPKPAGHFCPFLPTSSWVGFSRLVGRITQRRAHTPERLSVLGIFLLNLAVSSRVQASCKNHDDFFFKNSGLKENIHRKLHRSEQRRLESTIQEANQKLLQKQSEFADLGSRVEILEKQMLQSATGAQLLEVSAQYQQAIFRADRLASQIKDHYAQADSAMNQLREEFGIEAITAQMLAVSGATSKCLVGIDSYRELKERPSQTAAARVRPLLNRARLDWKDPQAVSVEAQKFADSHQSGHVGKLVADLSARLAGVDECSLSDSWSEVPGSQRSTRRALTRSSTINKLKQEYADLDARLFAQATQLGAAYRAISEKENELISTTHARGLIQSNEALNDLLSEGNQRFEAVQKLHAASRKIRDELRDVYGLQPNNGLDVAKTPSAAAFGVAASKDRSSPTAQRLGSHYRPCFRGDLMFIGAGLESGEFKPTRLSRNRIKPYLDESHLTPPTIPAVASEARDSASPLPPPAKLSELKARPLAPLPPGGPSVVYQYSPPPTPAAAQKPGFPLVGAHRRGLMDPERSGAIDQTSILHDEPPRGPHGTIRAASRISTNLAELLSEDNGEDPAVSVQNDRYLPADGDPEPQAQAPGGANSAIRGE